MEGEGVSFSMIIDQFALYVRYEFEGGREEREEIMFKVGKDLCPYGVVAVLLNEVMTHDTESDRQMIYASNNSSLSTRSNSCNILQEANYIKKPLPFPSL